MRNCGAWEVGAVNATDLIVVGLVLVVLSIGADEGWPWVPDLVQGLGIGTVIMGVLELRRDAP